MFQFSEQFYLDFSRLFLFFFLNPSYFSCSQTSFEYTIVMAKDSMPGTRVVSSEICKD